MATVPHQAQVLNSINPKLNAAKLLLLPLEIRQLNSDQSLIKSGIVQHHLITPLVT